MMDPGRSQSEANTVDPFSWPLDTFNQITPSANKVVHFDVIMVCIRIFCCDRSFASHCKMMGGFKAGHVYR